jgi:3-carboxy-cis,cis-muconate cycloisomerase
MRENLDRTGGLLLSESVAARLSPTLGRDAAHDLVSACARRATESAIPFGDVLRSDERVREVLSEDDLTAALDPEAWLGEADELVTRALASHAQRVRGGRVS